jgi:hypothetical protein
VKPPTKKEGKKTRAPPQKKKEKKKETPHKQPERKNKPKTFIFEKRKVVEKKAFS